MDSSVPLASIIVCESVLTEKTGVGSAIRIMDILTVGPASLSARFFVMTFLHPTQLDLGTHALKVQMLGLRNANWVIVADAPEYKFSYGYEVDVSGPGALQLTTEFNVDIAALGQLGTFFIQAIVDGNFLIQTPLTLRRRPS
jgi:hypothetical protein